METKPVYVTQPGRYAYTDPGQAPEPIEVVLASGMLYARFQDLEGGFELVPIEDMAGTFSAASIEPPL